MFLREGEVRDVLTRVFGVTYIEFDGETHTFEFMGRQCYASFDSGEWQVGHTWDISTYWENDWDEWFVQVDDLGVGVAKLAERFVIEDTSLAQAEVIMEREAAEEMEGYSEELEFDPVFDGEVGV